MIQQVLVQFNGEWITLKYFPDTGTWEGQFTPETTSFHQPGGYYNIAVEAWNDAGNSSTVDGLSREELQLVVREHNPPVILLMSPEEGYLKVSQPEIEFAIVDEYYGSWINIESLVVNLDGEEVPEGSVEYLQRTERGYSVYYKPLSPLAEGPHTIEVKISDNDGNETSLTVSYIIDTLPPVITVPEPGVRTVVNTPSVLFSGTIKDPGTPVMVKVYLNNKQIIYEEIPQPQGVFTWEIPLLLGKNTIAIKAKDCVDWLSSQSFTIYRVVTDRTQEDVNTLAALMAKPQAEWTEEEAAQFLEAQARGAYNYTDLNRVTTVANHLAEKFAGYGHDPQLIPVYIESDRTQWQEEDWPTEERMAGYLANIERLRALFDLAIPLPASMAELTFQRANQLESVMVELDKLSPGLQEGV